MMLNVSSYLCFYESEVIHIDILQYWHHGFNMFQLLLCHTMWLATVKSRNLYSYGHLLVITGYFYGIIHSINGVFLVLITGILGHNCIDDMFHAFGIYDMHLLVDHPSMSFWMMRWLCLGKETSQTCEAFSFWIPGRSGVCSLVPNDDGLLYLALMISPSIPKASFNLLFKANKNVMTSGNQTAFIEDYPFS